MSWRAEPEESSAGEPLDQVDVGARPDELVEPRHDVDDHVLVAKRADELHRPCVVLSGERDDHAFDRVTRDEVVES